MGIVLFKLIVVIAICPGASVVNMERHYSYLKALCQITERNWSIILVDVVKCHTSGTEKEAFIISTTSEPPVPLLEFECENCSSFPDFLLYSGQNIRINLYSQTEELEYDRML